MKKIATAETFKGWEERYQSYSDAQLAFARADCHAAALAQPDDAGYYMDQSSVIIREQNRRATLASRRRIGRARRNRNIYQ